MQMKTNVCCLSDGNSSIFASRIKSLSNIDCSVRHASDYNELVRIVNETTPDFFCFYINKASSETLSLCSRVKDNFPSIPALLVTHLRSEALAVWALRAQIWDYFTEPVDESEFIQSVNAILEMTQGKKNREVRNPTPRRLSIPQNQSNVESHKEKAVRLAIEYIQVNYPNKISQSQLASSLGMSTAYFSQSFHQITGTSFSDYLIKVRIMSAAKLLGKHSVPVSSVCYEVGFNDHSYFTKVFKRITGKTPSEYKNSELIPKYSTLK